MCLIDINWFAYPPNTFLEASANISFFTYREIEAWKA